MKLKTPKMGTDYVEGMKKKLFFLMSDLKKNNNNK